MTTAFKGFAKLQQPADLYLKLVHDRKRMALEPRDPYAAFDFFVTAEHMLDWVFPGMDKGPKAKRTALRKSSPVLRIVSHVANGSKHFAAESKHHQSVENIVSSGYAEEDYAENYFEVLLVVELSAAEQSELEARFLTTLQLPDRALAFWETYLGLAPPPDAGDDYEPELLPDL